MIRSLTFFLVWLAQLYVLTGAHVSQLGYYDYKSTRHVHADVHNAHDTVFFEDLTEEEDENDEANLHNPNGEAHFSMGIANRIPGCDALFNHLNLQKLSVDLNEFHSLFRI